MSHFVISDKEIDIIELSQQFTSPNAGAISTFQGIVRNNNLNKEVLNLEYESYNLLAEKEGNLIISEAFNNFDIEYAFCIHRTGLLEIGHIAVFIIVLAGHRDASFQACRYIIDETKIRVPIWKKENYKSGNSGWLSGAG